MDPAALRSALAWSATPSTRCSRWTVKDLDDELGALLDAQRAAGTFKRFRVLDAPQGPRTRLRRAPR